MIGAIISIIITLGAVFLVLWLIGQYYPKAPQIIVAIIIVLIILGLLRLMHGWVCGWMCG